MHLLTRKQLKKMLCEANENGYKRGYEIGYRKGMTQDKEGVVMSSSGLYVFNGSVEVSRGSDKE
ncbi:hypothetical protein [Bacillus toyonensis]|uniref:hypothetical protein n=1 Tax=Bacillus toyonensis TaxID=155322 RepID=UPI000BFCFEB7|nr:hypothetical protein [Bacillus toyonensis]PHC14390.1 hypothetical protein COF03_25100 [Bacillus toyonensis]